MVPKMADGGRVTPPFSFPVFIFFVSCHVGTLTSSSMVGETAPFHHVIHKRQLPRLPQRQEATTDDFSVTQLYPIFLEEPTSQVVGTGRSVYLNCSYLSRLKMEVRWLVNGSIATPAIFDRLGIMVSSHNGERNEEENGDDDDDMLDYSDAYQDGFGEHGTAGRRTGHSYNSNYVQHYSNNSTDESYQGDGNDENKKAGDDDDDDDEYDDDDKRTAKYSSSSEKEDNDGGFDVANFRAQDFPKLSKKATNQNSEQNPKHSSKESTTNRHATNEDTILNPTNPKSPIKYVQKRELNYDWSDDDPILEPEVSIGKILEDGIQKRGFGYGVDSEGYQRPKSTIHKNLATLHIPSFVPGFHEGVYQCLLVTDDVGSILSKEAKIEAAYMRLFDALQEKTTQMTAFLRGSVVIPCYPPDSRPDAVVEFKVNGSKLNLTERHLLLPSGNLQIWNLTFNDVAVYQCFALNPVSNVATVASMLQSLKVIAPTAPQPIKYSSPNQEFAAAILGQNLTLECSAQGWPQPNITWEKYGGHLPEDRSRLIMGNLLIERVEGYDAGTYLCRASNDVGTEPRDKVFSVEVLEPPTVVVSPAIVKATLGKSATLSCRVDGAPRPTIQWLHNGVPISKDADKDSSLVLTNIKASQAGTYQCVGRNNIALEQGFARLLVLTNDNSSSADDAEVDRFDEMTEDEKVDHEVTGQLPAPSRPEVTKISNSSVKVRWSFKGHSHSASQPSGGESMVPPDSPSPSPISFKIQYKEVSDDASNLWRTVMESIEPSKRWHEVRKLRPGGTYRFRVVVSYSNGDNKHSPNSAKVSMATKPSSPVPIIVDVRPISATQLQIGWQVQTDSWLPDGFVVSYIQNDLDFNDALKKQIDRPEARQVTLSDLEPSTQYKVRVHSYSSVAGKSASSNTAVKKTLDGGSKYPYHHHTHPPNPPPHYDSPIDDPNGGRGPYDGDEDGEVKVDNPPYRHNDNIGSSSLMSQSGLVYIILGSLLSLVVMIVIGFLILCTIKRRRHEFGQKEKEKLKEKGIERLKQSSSLNATAPLLCNESQRGATGGYQKSKSQSTLVSQNFPSQSFHQNYPIKPKPSYTGSALVSMDNTGRPDSPFHASGSQRNLQSRVQGQVSRSQHQDMNPEQYLFQKVQQPEDQNHIYSTLEEPRENSPHSSCPSSASHPRFYPTGITKDYPKEISEHQLFQHAMGGSHHMPRLQEMYPSLRIQAGQGRPLPGAPQELATQMPSNRSDHWYPAESANLNSLTREQATNTINSYYDNDPTAENGFTDWSENAYSTLGGFASAINQEQCLQDFSANGSVPRSVASSADSSSLGSDFHPNDTGSAIPSYPRSDEIVRQPTTSLQNHAHQFSHKSGANATPILPSKHSRNGSNCLQPAARNNNQQDSHNHRHYLHYTTDRTK